MQRAAFLPASLEHLRGSRLTGSVVAVFERSAYLDLGGRLVALASHDLERGPISISLERGTRIAGIAPGMPAAVGGALLSIDGTRIDLGGAEVWDARLPRAERAPAGSREAVVAELLSRAPRESVAAAVLGSRESRAGQVAAALSESLRDGLNSMARLLADPLCEVAACEAREAVSARIAGLGPGLTPSGDDLLVGIANALTTLHRAPETEGALARKVLIDAALSRTSRISAAYLEAACAGDASLPWHRLVRSLGGERDDLRRAARRLLRVGETSGADALAGFCWAWERLEG